jgi:transcription-repair coupling factor (superfamily II helicase)
LPCTGIAAPAQPFFVALVKHLFPRRPIVVVTDNLKTQETFQQDLETWMRVSATADRPPSHLQLPSAPLFFPAWDILPHEGKLPHADVISERLQTLVALSGRAGRAAPNAELVNTSVTALLQHTFAPGALNGRMRSLARGGRADPLELVEWLKPRAEPRHRSRRKAVALRGGILDVYPPTSPWPARLEFFGDELESLRYFDPLTQVSREEIHQITLPPAGELGLLKQLGAGERDPDAPRATLLDYLPADAIFLLCEPEQLAQRADEYAQQVPAGDGFHLSWSDFLRALEQRGLTCVEVGTADPLGASVCDPAPLNGKAGPSTGSETGALALKSLDAFRPLGERTRAADRRSATARFFSQLHRWQRQVMRSVFCNNDGSGSGSKK